MTPLAGPFQAYVQQLTGQEPVWAVGSSRAMPAYLRQRFEPRLVTLAGQAWLVALLLQPDPPPPLQLRKLLEQLAARFDTPVAGVCLVAEHLPPYMRTRLVQLGQAFVVPGRQLFWPAIGSVETVQRPRRLRPGPAATLEPLAQQLLIALLLRRLLPPITITAAAQALDCSAASMSQAVKALEAAGLVESQLQGRERVLALADAAGAIWQRAQPLLRSPVRQRIRLRQADLPAAVVLRAGDSALASLTDLAEPVEPVYAVASRQWRKQAVPAQDIPMPDAGTCVVELWRYRPEATAVHGSVDPLSLHASLRDQTDERVQLALQGLMEQIAW